MKKAKEIRSLIDIVSSNDEMKLIGAIKYNRESEYMGFREVILPTAFNKTLADNYDVRAYFGHDTNKVIGRVKNGSLELENTADELRFVIHLPDTQEARDYHNLVKDGYVSGVSFGMIVVKETNEVRDGIRYRYINECALREISIVSEPAYPDNFVDARALEEETETREECIQTEQEVVVETTENPVVEEAATNIDEDKEQPKLEEPVIEPEVESEPSHEEVTTLTDEEQEQLIKAMERLLELEKKLQIRSLRYGI